MPRVRADWALAPAVARGAATQEVHDALGPGPHIVIENVIAGLLAGGAIAAALTAPLVYRSWHFLSQAIGKRAIKKAPEAGVHLAAARLHTCAAGGGATRVQRQGRRSAVRLAARQGHGPMPAPYGCNLLMQWGVAIGRQPGSGGFRPRPAMAAIFPMTRSGRQRQSAKSGYVSGVDSETGADQNKKPMISGRSGRIRTCDPCVPNAVLYRAEPHSDKNAAYSPGFRTPQEADRGLWTIWMWA
jgi:hypothetical protein